MLSFQDLRDNHNLQNQDHFRYLQIRDFISKKFLKDETIIGDEILDIFQKAHNDGTYQKIISRLYRALQNLKGDHTLNIKTGWEAEGNLTITVEEWDRICEHQRLTTSSPSWREAGRT